MLFFIDFILSGGELLLQPPYPWGRRTDGQAANLWHQFFQPPPHILTSFTWLSDFSQGELLSRYIPSPALLSFRDLTRSSILTKYIFYTRIYIYMVYKSYFLTVELFL